VTRSTGSPVRGSTAISLQSTLSVWYLGIDSELVFVGDAATTLWNGEAGFRFSNKRSAHVGLRLSF
jgi:hypothetical protein